MKNNDDKDDEHDDENDHENLDDMLIKMHKIARSHDTYLHTIPSCPPPFAFQEAFSSWRSSQHTSASQLWKRHDLQKGS